MRSPPRIEFSYAENENTTNRNITCIAATEPQKKTPPLSMHDEHGSRYLRNMKDLTSPDVHRGNGTGFEQKLNPHYYVPMRSKDTETTRVYILNKWGITIMIFHVNLFLGVLGSRKITTKINWETKLEALYHILENDMATSITRYITDQNGAPIRSP